MTTPAVPLSLGSSLELDSGDLVFDNQAGDLVMVTGTGALSQALVLSLETQLGSDRINSGFGFDRAAVGAYAYGVHTQKEYVKLQLVRCVGLDRRVKTVREVFFQDDPRYFELNPQLDLAAQEAIAAAARASRDYTVYVIVETINSDVVTLQAGGTLG
ncbi:MAG: hypothetical protein ABSB59_43195 [Streptosporangiaceae bacterium]|jgi:hypothetical protein